MKYRNLFVFPLLTLLLFGSCTKEPDELGLDLIQQENLKVKHTDTITLFAHSIIDDSIRSDELSLSLLGSISDPFLGRTTSSIYTQLRLSSNEPDFGTNPVADSLILTLRYGGYFGDTTAVMTVNVYEILEDFYEDSTYYSYKTLTTSDISLCHHTFIPRISDSLNIDGDLLAPHLRINLTSITDILAEKLLNASAEELADNTAFLDFFKGLYITAEPVNYGGCILYFDLLSTLSKMTIYYSNDESDSLSFDFQINEACAYFSHFEHYGYDQASQPFRNQVLFNDTLLGQDQLYLQALGGTMIEFRIPYAGNFREKGKYAINEAQLIIPNIDTDSELAPPTSLTLVKKNSEGELTLVQDQNEGTAYFGGSYLDGQGEYRFRISRYFQSLMDGNEETNRLVLIVAARSVRANRVIIGGPENEERPMRIELIYTEIE